jgi:1,4-dihydroxy-2-naphthoate octaprenyltransferase
VNNSKTLIGTMRLPFLALTPACIFLGYAFALLDFGDVNYFYVALILLGGLSASISSNVFNEYMDFNSGLDLKTNKTPFSGGSGALPKNPGAAKQVLVLAVFTLVLTILIGLYFISIIGWGLAPLGLLGVLIILAYTNHITRNPWLCLIVSGLGYGPLMVMGTYFVLTGSYSLSVALASLVPFFLVNNLLLLNQYPDIDADKEIGRFVFPVAFGKLSSNKIFFVFYFFAYLVLVAAVIFDIFPVESLVGLLTVVIAAKVVQIISSNIDDTQKMIPAMGMNVAINIFTPVLISLGVIWGS